MLKSYFALVALFTLSILSAQNQTHLQGEMFVSLSNEYFNARYVLSNVPVGDNALSFMLNEDIKVEQVYLNNTPIASSKNGKICQGCKVHNILINRPLEEDDKLVIAVKGKFKNHKPEQNPLKDSGKIFSSPKLVQADGQAKWYPIILEGGLAEENALRKYEVSYDIQVSCVDCEYVAVGSEQPQAKRGQFSSMVAQDNISLLVGDFKFSKGKYAIYGDVEETALTTLDQNFKDISDYYARKTGLTLKQRPFLMHLKDGKEPNFDPNNSETKARLSYAIADALLKETYKPNSEFYLFYRESLSNYLGLKYLKDNDPATYIAEARKLEGEDAFIRLDKLEDNKDLIDVADNRVVPFQFLAIENVIGEDKMLALVDTLIHKLENGEEGYNLLTSSLQEVGLNEEGLAQIENTIITKFTSEALFPSEEVIVGF